jgi:hypothetical protein
MGSKDRSLSFPTRSTVTQSPSWAGSTTNMRGATCIATRTSQGVSNRNWRQQVKEGENATTPFNGVYDSIEHSRMSGSLHGEYIPEPFTMDVRVDPSDFVLDNAMGPRRPRDPIMDTSKALSGAAAKFYAAVRKQQVQFSGPTFLGELGEALHMLRRPGEALYSGSKGFLDALKKAKRKDPKDWMKTASGLWLEHSFGWLPLIHDAEDAATALRRLGKVRTKKVQASFVDNSDQSWTLSGVDNTDDVPDLGGLHLNHKGRLLEKVIVRYRGGVAAQAATPEWDNWSLFGFTPSEFLPTAWELLPWSFLADYFTNIGDMITAAVTDTSKVTYVNVSVIRESSYEASTSLNSTGTLQALFPPSSWVAGGTVSPGSCTLKRKVVNRSAGVGLPIVTFQMNTGLGLGQKLNVLALLGQANALHPQKNYRWRRG